MLHFCLLFKVPEIINEYYHNNRYPTILCAVYITVIPSFVHISPTTSLVVYAKFFCLTVMAQPPPVQRPLQVRAQDVLANVQAAPVVPVPQHGPQAVPAVPAHVAVQSSS